MKQELVTIGWREWVGLPELGISRIKVKVDTGARTSSLHAFGLEFFRRGRTEMVRFEVHPEQRSSRKSVLVEVPVHERRIVKPSSGHEENRVVIITALQLDGREWPVELNLTRRDSMGFRMLLGRQAVRGNFVVDPGSSYLAGKPPKKKKKKSKSKSTSKSKSKSTSKSKPKHP